MTTIETTTIETAAAGYVGDDMAAFISAKVARWLPALSLADTDQERRDVVSTIARLVIKMVENHNLGPCLDPMCYSLRSSAKMEWGNVESCFVEMYASDEEATHQNSVEMAVAVEASKFINSN